MNNDSIYIKFARIGLRLSFSGEQKKSDCWVDIEQTIIDACYAVDSDSKMLSYIFSWASVHGKYLITEKLEKLRKVNIKYRGDCPYIMSLYAYLNSIGITKFKRYLKKSKDKIALGEAGEESFTSLKGEIDYLKEINLIRANGTIRIREDDALTPKELIKINPQYKNRFLYGTSWRADIITAIEWGMLTPYQISKELGCSYEPANRIFHEYKIAHAV